MQTTEPTPQDMRTRTGQSLSNASVGKRDHGYWTSETASVRERLGQQRIEQWVSL
jgi:hypothetical protein